MPQSFTRFVVRAVFVLALLFGFNSLTLASPLLVTQQQDPSSIPRYLTDQLIPEANQSSGALIHDYPIQVPPGRNGLQPDLKLTYNNQGTEEGSIFGSGWSVNIPSIERINRKGSEQLYSQDFFYSSLSGELASTSASTWGAKIDSGDFLKYTFASSTWTVVDKKGTIYKFGITTGSRQDDPNDSTRINKWMLEEVRDTNDNYIKYVYYKDAGQIYPSQIIYTGNGTTDGAFEVDFLRESRNDVATSSRPQFNVISKYRVSEIDTKISGTLAHKYVLSYSNGANGSRSILTSITESGIDDSSNTTTLPATTFSYQGQTPGWTANSNYASPVAFSAETQTGQGTVLADVNGDGLVDVLYSGPEWNGTGFSIVSHVWLNNGNGWALDTSWSIPEAFSYSGYGEDVGTRVADVNGDGSADILSTKYAYVDDGNGAHHWDSVNRVYINNGSGWTYDSSWVLPTILIGGGSGGYVDNGTRIFDVNGDGLPDIVYSTLGGYNAVYLNTGSGWVLNTNWVMPVSFLASDTQQQATELADVNGDGLLDVLWTGYAWNNGWSGISHVWLNNGNGWALDTSWSIPEQFEDFSYYDYGTRLADVNGDGLADILSSRYDGSNHVYLNNGHGWSSDASWSIPVSFIRCGGVCFRDNGVRLADVNGDGITDILYAAGGPATTYLGNSHRVDSLTQITNPKGGSTSIAYKPSTQYVSGSTLLNPNLPLTLGTVSHVSNSDGLGNTSTTQYKYEGGKLHFNGPFDRRFAGYSKVTTTDAAGSNTINYYHQGDTSNSSQGEYNDHASKIGKIYRTETTDSSGNIYSKTINKWDKYDFGNERNFVKQTQQVALTYDGDSSHKDKTEIYTYDNANGNITQKTQLGQVTGADDGTYTDTGTDDFTTAYTYASNTGANILGLPDDVVVTDHGATKVKEDRYYYDTQSLGNVTKGNETKHEQWKSGSTYINTQKTYDGTYGLVTQSSDARSKNTGYGYDSYNVYPATITDPLSHTTYYTYDYSSGQMKQKTDPNSRVFQSVYDGMDRLVAEKQPDQSSPSTLVTKTVYAYTDTSGAVSVHKTDNLDGSTAVETYTYFDGLGRKIQERKEAEGSNYAVRDYVYNNLGLLQKESLPYFSSGSSKTSPVTTTSLYTTYTYDPMQRVVSSVSAVGTTSNTYLDWKTTTTDPRSKTRDLYKDARGNLTQIDEHNGGTTYSTYYIYNYLGNLVSITDASGNVRNFTYDGLGKNLTAQDLHASGDTSYGTWTYTYDNTGNLTQKVDPKSQTINYTYDDINRPLTEDYTGASGTEVTNTYDSGTNGIGHLTGITTATLTQTNTYNPIGLVASESKVVSGATYSTSYTYDYQGRQVVITNPDSSQVKYIYNSAGLLDQVQRKESTDSSFVDVVSNFDYSPTGQITNAVYVNGVSTANIYDPVNLYRLTSKTSAVSNPPSNYNPVITLTGSTLINLNIGATWTEPGYSAVDTEDGSRTSFVTVTGSVNTAVPGTYQLVYSVVDSQGLPAEGKIRTVVVHGTALGTVKVLVIAGGGGTGTPYSAGGGAGGYQYNAPSSVINGPHTITVGAGGTGGTTSPTNGGNSVFDADGTPITAIGGGQGGRYGGTMNGGSGGCGGGGGYYSGVGGTGSQGGNGGVLAGNGAGGGGGKSTNGQDGQASGGGVGGDGIINPIAGSTLGELIGSDYWILGGGAGSSATAASVTGGKGGGGASNNASAGVSGTPNTGGGGGGTWAGSTGGAGGSGGVVIAYHTDGSDGILASSTGGIITTSGGYTIHTFTSSGTWTMVATSSVGVNLSNNNPVITLTGTNLINLNVGDTWTEPGYSTTDTEDGSLTASTTITGAVNTAVAGTYQLVYNVVDSQGAPADGKIRTVIVHTVGGSNFQNISYTYDANGNITQIVDASNTNASKTVAYTYDDLNRMLSATATNVASGTSAFTNTYAYNALGNITSGPLGLYTYAGNSGGSYANPHAVTTIASSTLTYDNNGNTLTSGSAYTNTWDYANRIIQTLAGSSTLAYTYDPTGQRLTYAVGTSTITVYPSMYYNTDGVNTTKHIFANGIEIATVTGSGASSTPHYVLTDNLLGSSVTTSASGAQEEMVDYLPYGSIRLNEKSGTYTDQRKYAGSEYDTESGLNYMNARYYDGGRGQFISQDPVFWELGQTKDGRDAMINPQTMNSYSYAGNNPIINRDPSGKWAEISFSAVLPFRSFSIGLGFDRNGIDLILGGGVGYGFEAGIEAQWAPGVSLSHVKEGTLSAQGVAALGIGLNISKDIITAGGGKIKNNNDITSSYVLGGGAGVSVQEKLTKPLYIWGSSAPAQTSSAKESAQTSSSLPSRMTNSSVSGQSGKVINEASKK